MEKEAGEMKFNPIKEIEDWKERNTGINGLDHLRSMGLKPNIMIPIESPVGLVTWNGKDYTFTVGVWCFDNAEQLKKEFDGKDILIYQAGVNYPAEGGKMKNRILVRCAILDEKRNKTTLNKDT